MAIISAPASLNRPQAIFFERETDSVKRPGSWILSVAALFCPSLFSGFYPGGLAFGQIAVEPRSIDFGSRGQGERPEVELTIRNLGTEAVAIGEMKRSCDCIQLSPASLPPLGAGHSTSLKVSMGSGRAMGRLDKSITLTPSDPRFPAIQVPVSMRVLDEFEMEPYGIRLDGVIGGPVEQAVVEVRRRRTAPSGPLDLQIKAIQGRFSRPSGTYLRAAVETTTAGKKIVVELPPTHPVGPVSAEIEATLNGRPLFVSVSGEMFAWIKVSPNYINFSRAEDDKPASKEQQVLLSAPDGNGFRILEVSVRPGRTAEIGPRLDFFVEPVGEGGKTTGAVAAPGSSPPSASHRLTCRVSRVDRMAKVFSGTLVLKTDHPKKPEIELRYSGFFADPPGTGKKGP